MKKTGDEFKAQAQRYRILEWRMHECSICGYPCGFVFQGDVVKYDSGCNCVSAGLNLQPRAWEAVADHYNLQTNPEYIAEMNTFWHFDGSSTPPLVDTAVANYRRDFEGWLMYYIIDPVQRGPHKIKGAPNVDLALFLDQDEAERRAKLIRDLGLAAEVREVMMPYVDHPQLAVTVSASKPG